MKFIEIRPNQHDGLMGITSVMDEPRVDVLYRAPLWALHIVKGHRLDIVDHDGKWLKPTIDGFILSDDQPQWIRIYAASMAANVGGSMINHYKNYSSRKTIPIQAVIPPPYLESYHRQFIEFHQVMVRAGASIGELIERTERFTNSDGVDENLLAAISPVLTDEQVDRLIRHKNFHVRKNLACEQRLTEEHENALSIDKQFLVRMELVRNQYLRRETVERLTKDRHDRVKTAAKLRFLLEK